MMISTTSITTISRVSKTENQEEIAQGTSWETEYRLEQHKENILNKVPELLCELESLFPQLKISTIVHRRSIGENVGEFEDYLIFYFTICGCKDELGWEKQFFYEVRYAISYSEVEYIVLKKAVIDFFADFLEKEEMT